MARIPASVMYERRRAIMRFLLKRANKRNTVKVSHKQLMDELGLSINELRNAMASLESDNLIVVTHCYRNDGGQRENTYRVTAKGRHFALEGLDLSNW